MSTVDKPASENKLRLFFDGEEAKNIFINVAIPGIFPTEKLSTKFNCREHYEKFKFVNVNISYDYEKGMIITAYPTENDNKIRQELYIPERYIVCVGVDYES